MKPMPCPAGSKPDAALAKRDLFKKIINYMTIGIDMSSLFMQVMTAGMSSAEDVVLKKQLYLFICTYAVWQSLPHASGILVRTWSEGVGSCDGCVVAVIGRDAGQYRCTNMVTDRFVQASLMLRQAQVLV